VRRYETLVLLSPEPTPEERTAVLETLTGVIEREGGTVLAKDEWGARELAYPVKKQHRGLYVRLEYTCPAKAVAELERIIRIQDMILKFITVQLAQIKKPEEVS